MGRGFGKTASDAVDAMVHAFGINNNPTPWASPSSDPLGDLIAAKGALFAERGYS